MNFFVSPKKSASWPKPSEASQSSSTYSKGSSVEDIKQVKKFVKKYKSIKNILNSINADRFLLNNFFRFNVDRRFNVVESLINLKTSEILNVLECHLIRSMLIFTIKKTPMHKPMSYQLFY